MLDRDITRVLYTLLVCSTACTVCGTALAASALAELCAGAPRRAAAATLGFAAGSIFLGELLPKTLAVANAERVARRAVPLVRAAAVVLAPVGAFFGALAQLCLAPLGLAARGDAAALGVSERGLRLLVAGARRSGALGARESRMVDGVLDLRATRVAEVMTPRVDVVALAGGAPLSEALDLMRAAKRSRVLVYEKDVDDVVGVLLAKTLIRYAERGGAAALRATRARDEPALESPYFVPGSMSVWAALESLRRRRRHLAVVVDEYGGTAGIVTLEDILEEVVGEIYDEDDAAEGADRADRSLIQVVRGAGDRGRGGASRTYVVRGEAELDDVRAALFGPPPAPAGGGGGGGSGGAAAPPLDDRAFDCVTLSGYLCAVHGEIPAVGVAVVDSGYRFTVARSDARRVREVLAEPVDGEPAAPPTS
ncbi:unnamed protein product [Pelagomonas calceolata]|uniref:CNNM transmembrane domain-containing protein n=2 Tax=Pelagomonas calceolata TaxID=35677 RepID=A0A8J2SLQ3_9STRA|nr:unnamed protein product [Pelagomonas calceolata]